MHYTRQMGLISKLLGRSTLTDRYQTTIPAFVRKELGLKRRDYIEFLKSDDGYVVLRKARPEETPEDEIDPELLSWLSFISRDLEQNPQQLVPLNEDFFSKARELVGNQPIEPDEEIPAS